MSKKKTPKEEFIDRYCERLQVVKSRINSETCSPLVTSSVVRKTFKVFDEVIEGFVAELQKLKNKLERQREIDLQNGAGGIAVAGLYHESELIKQINWILDLFGIEERKELTLEEKTEAIRKLRLPKLRREQKNQKQEKSNESGSDTCYLTCTTGKCSKHPDCMYRKCPDCGAYAVNFSGNCRKCGKRVRPYIAT